jgi:hypothetical protein
MERTAAKPARAALLLLLLMPVALVGLGGGCASVRQTADLTDPVPVYIGDYGVHSSLFLPTTDDRFVEYASGDWGYAVENRNMPQDAIGALTVSRGAAFGRQYHDPAPRDRGAPNPVHKPFTLRRVYCDRADVYALIDKLDVRYERLAERHGRPVVNPETGIAWVRDDAGYSIANNCNHLTARSLEELGCRVSGVVILSKFSVEQANGEPPPSRGRAGQSWASAE